MLCADKCHLAKEEDLFFPLLKERGIPEEGGPIGVMLHEHVMGRDCVGRMREACEADEFDGATFATAAKEFIPLLRHSGVLQASGRSEAHVSWITGCESGRNKLIK